MPTDKSGAPDAASASAGKGILSPGFREKLRATLTRQERDDLRKLPLQWEAALIPLRHKAKPWDPVREIGEKWQTWPTTPLNVLAQAGAVGVRMGRISRIAALDFDAAEHEPDGADLAFLQVFGLPSSELPMTVAWTSGKQGRRSLAFTATAEQFDRLDQALQFIQGDGESKVELRWSGYCAFLGAHTWGRSRRDSEGEEVPVRVRTYSWLPGCRPDQIEVAPLPDWLLDAWPLKAKSSGEHPNLEPTEGWGTGPVVPFLPFLAPATRTWLKTGDKAGEMNDNQLKFTLDLVGAVLWLKAHRCRPDVSPEDLFEAYLDLCPQANLDRDKARNRLDGAYGRTNGPTRGTRELAAILRQQLGTTASIEDIRASIQTLGTTRPKPKMTDPTTSAEVDRICTLLGEWSYGRDDQKAVIEQEAAKLKGSVTGLLAAFVNDQIQAALVAKVTQMAPLETILQARQEAEEEAARVSQVHQQLAASEAIASAAPFRVLGYNADRTQIIYQEGTHGQLGSVSPFNNSDLALIPLAPMTYWLDTYGVKQGDGSVRVSWDWAKETLCAQAGKLPAYEPERGRGRGIWRDSGQTVWHIGDRLIVDGKDTKLVHFDGQSVYRSSKPLGVRPDAEPLDCITGQKVLQLLKGYGWASPLSGIHVLGWTVCAIAAGSVHKRPCLQLTGPHGEGKTHRLEKVILPLLGGCLASYTAASTEAGLRQSAGCDAMAIVVDESEKAARGERNSRKDVLTYARFSYEGSGISKGSAGGTPAHFPTRCSVALAGINAPIPNPADRSRFAIVTCKQLPLEQWKVVDAERESLITAELGHSLVRRVAENIPRLLAGIQVFKDVLNDMGKSGREGDTLGHLYGAAHFVTSRALPTAEEALDWLNEHGFGAVEDEDNETTTGTEMRDCLEHLLSYRVRWSTNKQSPETPIHELIALAREKGVVKQRERLPAGDVRACLRDLGIKVFPDFLQVAYRGPGIESVFAGTKWAEGAHRQHLLQLDGAERIGPDRFGPHLYNALTFPYAKPEEG